MIDYRVYYTLHDEMQYGISYLSDMTPLQLWDSIIEEESAGQGILAIRVDRVREGIDREVVLHRAYSPVTDRWVNIL